MGILGRYTDKGNFINYYYYCSIVQLIDFASQIGQPGWCDASHDVTYTNYLTVHHLKGSGFFLGSMVVVMPDGSIV